MVGELSDLQNDRRGHARHGCRRGPAGQRDFDIVDIQGVSPTDGVSVFVLPCEQGRFDEGDLFGKCPVRLRDLFRITVFSSASDGAIRPCVCGSVPLKNLSRKTPKRSAGASIIHDSKIRGHLAHWNQGYRPSPYEWPGASACAIGGHCASRRGHQREDSGDYVSDRGRSAILRKKMA